MIRLDMITGDMGTMSQQNNFSTKKGYFDRNIFTFLAKSGKFFAGEMTIEWLLFMLKSPETFLQNFLKEFNKKPVILQENEAKIFLQFLFSDVNKNQKNSKEKPINSDETLESMLISIGLLVKHGGFAYSDIMKMSVKNFYIFLENLDVITGQKTLQEKKGLPDSEENMKKFFKNLPRGEYGQMEK